MSFADGMAALNLQMPDRVPRTEYSVESHWELIRIVTGLDVAVDSPPEIQLRATDPPTPSSLESSAAETPSAKSARCPSDPCFLGARVIDNSRCGRANATE